MRRRGSMVKFGVFRRLPNGAVIMVAEFNSDKYARRCSSDYKDSWVEKLGEGGRQ